MTSRHPLLAAYLNSAYTTLRRNVDQLSLEEALILPPGGYRSVLGTLKHAAGWSHVYGSFAFDAKPVGWTGLDWPYGLHDTIVKSQAYVDAVIGWMDTAQAAWQVSLAKTSQGTTRRYYSRLSQGM